MEIAADIKLIAKCGLYCGACPRYLKGKCPGCTENAKATWCKVRTCCTDNGIASCADCTTVGHASCKLFNNFMAKMFGFVFNSDRSKCVARIKEVGYLAYAVEMADGKMQTIKRR